MMGFFLAVLLLTTALCSVASAEEEYVRKISYSDVVTALRRSEGKETQTVFYTKEEVQVEEVKIYGGYGTFNPSNANASKWTEFSAFAGDGNASSSDFVADSGNSGSYKFGMQRWQWRASGSDQTFIRLTALVDCFIDVKNKELGDQWATDMSVAEYVADADGFAIKIRDAKIKATSDPHEFFEGVHLKAGDSLYILLTGGKHTPGTCNVCPHFEIYPGRYDAEKRADFSAAREIATTREEAFSELTALMETLSPDDYSAVNWSKISDLVYQTEVLLASLNDVEEMKATVKSAKEEIDAILTKAEEEAALKETKEEKKAELAALFNSEHYTKKNWELVEEELKKAYETIDNAKNVSMMNSAILVAKTRIAEIEVGGCGTTKQAEAGIVLGGLAAAIVVLGKKKED